MKITSTSSCAFIPSSQFPKRFNSSRQIRQNGSTSKERCPVDLNGNGVPGVYFPQSKQHLRWSHLKQEADADRVLRIVRDDVFPHFRVMGEPTSLATGTDVSRKAPSRGFLEEQANAPLLRSHRERLFRTKVGDRRKRIRPLDQPLQGHRPRRSTIRLAGSRSRSVKKTGSRDRVRPK